MTQKEEPAYEVNGPTLAFVWMMVMAGGVIIAVLLYFFAGDPIGEALLSPEYEVWLLVAGLASGFLTIPKLRRFREATQLKPGTAPDAEHWQRVGQAMFSGFFVADIPYFFGVIAYMFGNFVGTAAVMLALSIFLASRFKPPVR
jgi:hypothetical protein